MAIRIGEIKGLTPDLGAKLKTRGLSDSDRLLAAARTSAMRKELARELDVDPKVVLELANRADLARIAGIGGVYSDLLEESGVDTVKELAARNAQNLLTKMIAINDAKRLTNKPPQLDAVKDWIEQAKLLPRALEY